MLIKHSLKKRLIKSVLLLMGLVIALTLYPLTKNNSNLANDQDIVSNSNILYFPTINPGKDWQTTISITNSECKRKQRRVNATLTAYDKDGLSLGVIKNVVRLRANKTKTFHSQTLPTDAESLKVETNGNLICNAIFKTRDGTKSEVVPAIKESSRQLDFPALLSYDDLYIYKTITLLNPNTNPASVDIVALDKDGYEIDRNALPSLSSMESKTFSLVDIFVPKILKDLSTVRVNSDSNIIGLQLVDYPAVDLVGLPALTTTSKGWTFPIATKGENFDLWTNVGVLNPGNDIANVTFEAFDASNDSLGIIHSQTILPGVTYVINTANLDTVEGDAIPSNTAILKVASTQPVIGYEVIGVLNGSGLSAVMGIPDEDHTSVGFELTGSMDGGVLNTYSMVRMGDGSAKSRVGIFEDECWKKFVTITHVRTEITKTFISNEVTESTDVIQAKATSCTLPDISKPPFPVIFIHGISSSAETWAKFKDVLEDNGWKFGGYPVYNHFNLGLTKEVLGVNSGDFYTLNFTDNQRLHFSEQGYELAAIIEAVLKANPLKTKVILIGHSMGGLAARVYLQGLARFPDEDTNTISYRGDVARLITVGTPHGGADLAALGAGFLAFFGIDLKSEAVKDLIPDSKAYDPQSPLGLNNLIDNPLPSDIQYTSIIGTGKTVPGTSQDGDGVVTKDSQNLRNLAGAGGLKHQAISIFIKNKYTCSFGKFTHGCETRDKCVWVELLRQISLVTTNTTPTPSTTVTPSPTPTPTATTQPTPSPEITPGSTPTSTPTPTPTPTTSNSFTLAFPLSGKTAYTATISSVFDHSMSSSYCPYNGVIAYTDERGTVSGSYVASIKDCNNDGSKDPLYGFKKLDGSPFRINGYYAYTDTLYYDGHPGYDYPVPIGTDVFAAADGVVIASGGDSGGLGDYIKVEHRNGYHTLYGHLSSRLVSKGRNVTSRQLIGKSGNTGSASTGPHLHFEVRKNVNGVYVPVDPYGWEGTETDPYKYAEHNVNLWETTSSNDNPPSVSITSPASGVTVSGTVTVSANATDDNGIKKVEFYLNGSLKSTSTSSPYSWSWDSTQLTNTSHTIKVVAYDTADQTATSQISVTVNNTTTSITVTSPNGGETWQAGSTKTISWNYRGNPGSYVKIELLKSDSTYTTITSSTSIGSSGSGSYNWMIPSSQAVEIDYKIKITSTTNSSYTDTSNNNFTIQGQGCTLAVGPLTLNFGDVQVGSCSDAMLAVQNQAGAPTVNVTVATSPPFSITSNSSFTLGAGQGVNVGVRFCPTSAGQANGQVRVTSSTCNLTANVTGTGITQNQSPTINSLTADPTTVSPGGTSKISVSASDPDGDPLSYTWSTTGGSLSSNTGPGPVTWYAPGSTGNYTVTVSVTDNKPGHTPVSRSTTITVHGIPPGDFTLTASTECGNDNTPQIRLTWTSSSGVDYYQVYRNGVILDGINATSFLDTNVTLGTLYNYYVKAINSGGETKSNVVSITPHCENPPGAFKLTVIPWCENNNTPINIVEWTGAVGRTLPYEIYRDGSLIPTTDISGYNDKDVIAGTTYSYFVRAKNTFGYRDSNTVTVTTKSDCGGPLTPVIDTIRPQTVTIGDGAFTLTITGKYFDSSVKILWNFAGSEPGGPIITPTFVNSTTLTVGVSQNSGGFSSPFINPGSMVIQVIKPGPNFWDGQRSNIVSFTIFNPIPVVSSITGTCKANLNCTPGNGFDVRIYGSGFVRNLVNGKIDSTYVKVDGKIVNFSSLGQGVLQLFINGMVIPTQGTYLIEVCNEGTVQGTSCSTGYLTVTP